MFHPTSLGHRDPYRLRRPGSRLGVTDPTSWPPPLRWRRNVRLGDSRAAPTLPREGLSITAIAEALQVDRRTIHRSVAAGDLDRDPTTLRYGPQAPVPTQLDPYKPLLEERLTTYPTLTAVRLFEEAEPPAIRGA
jgi:hypothetical protein